MDNTISLCPTCYKEIPAELFVQDGQLWMRKTCPVHGETEALCERNAAFWYSSHQKFTDDERLKIYNSTTIIESTDRCNLNCKQCYHEPNNKLVDKPAEYIIAKALSVSTPIVSLMGAEPTVREDLPYILSQIRINGKYPSIYTNGIKISDREYLESLMRAGLHSLSVSVHTADYHNEKIYNKVIQGLMNAVELKQKMAQISFTVTNLENELKNAIETILKLRYSGVKPLNFCIRTPAEIGKDFDGDKEIFASDMYLAIKKIANGYKLPMNIINHANNPYHVAISLNGADILLIHWPTVKNIDIKYMAMGPYAAFVDGLSSSFCHNVIIREGIKKGWFNGMRLSEK